MKQCKYVVNNMDVLKTAYGDMVEALKEHGTLNLEWKRRGNDRSKTQNSLFHIWCGEIASQMYQRTGDESYTKIGVKLVLKKMFLGEETIKVGKSEIEKQIRKSSKLDKGEMFFFMQQVEAFAFENNLSLSHPADNEYDKLKEYQHAV